MFLTDDGLVVDPPPPAEDFMLTPTGGPMEGDPVSATARAVGGGVRDAAQGFIDLTGELGEVMNEVIPAGYLTWGDDGFHYTTQKPEGMEQIELPQVPAGDSVMEGVARGITQFVAGLALTRGGGTNIGAMTVRSAVSDALFDPEHGTMANWLRDLGVENELVEYLATDVDEDSDAYDRLGARLKQAFEGSLIGVPIDALMWGVKYAKTNPDLRNQLMESIGEFVADRSGTLKPRPDAVEDVSEIGFYSAVTRAVDALPQDKGTAVQMRQMIAKTQGVKPEEMAWIGLDDFLKGRKNVTKQEIKDFVESNQVRVEEVTLGSASRLDVETEMATDIQDVLEAGQVFDMDAQDALKSWQSSIRKFRSQHEALLEEKLRDAGDLRTVEEFREAASANVEPTKYGPNQSPDLSLPGGENYREVLLTLPPTKRLDEAAARLREFESSMKEEKRSGRFTIRRSIPKDKWPEGAEAEWNRLNEQIASAKPYHGGHYGGDHPNVLAHIRLNDRIGPNGEKILFVEEIQSDWHQKGRRGAYANPERLAELKAQRRNILEKRDAETPDWWPRLEELTDKRVAESLDGLTIAEQNEYISLVTKREAFDKETATALKAIDSEMSALIGSVPDAPLKTSWHEMSLRRVLRMAAEEGYDSVAWTPGKVQADRYDLSKVVEDISVKAVNENSRAVVIRAKPGSTIGQTYKLMVANDGVVTGYHDADQFTGKNIDEVVGKEIAEKIMATSEPKTFDGLDLEVGGEGMEGFYDKMLKNYAAKFGKKFGAKVGTVDLKGRRQPVQLRGAGMGWSSGVTEVWTIPITKRMRDSLMQEGAPLFSAAPIAATGLVTQGGQDSERINGN